MYFIHFTLHTLRNTIQRFTKGRLHEGAGRWLRSGEQCSFTSCPSDIVDIKPSNMEELTEVITAAEFHPQQCQTFAYSSSKGSIRLCDMRQAALCDKHCKCKLKLGS